MMFLKRAVCVMLVCSLSLACSCESKYGGFDKNTDNKYTAYAEVKNLDKGISWPDGQALPTFSSPAAECDAVSVTHYTEDELLTLTALQGIVNRTKPRILLLDDNPDEGAETWMNTSTVNAEFTVLKSKDRYDLFEKYAKEAKGYVLYDGSENPHIKNLASTVAALKDCIPVTEKVLGILKKKGVNLKVKVDLTELSFDSNVDLYNYLYDNYWDECNHRLLVSASPSDPQHVRDMAAATKSAVVYLDCTKEDEKAVFERFLKDMTAGNGLVLGWFTTERSGITTVTSYGLSTLPADLFISSTFYSGTDHNIAIPSVPDKPELENKMYVAIYISDGDNIQYNQRYMRKLWDQTKNIRGQIPLNWTVSPALADVAPAMLNYYYSTATENDCFVCGPSGLGYAMPVNTLSENGAPAINFLEGKDNLFKSYVSLTETYLQRTGLRVVTVWDNLSPSQRDVYTSTARHLYGLTAHDWFMGENASSTVNNGMRVQQLTPCYSGNTDVIKDRLLSEIQKWDGNSPAFFSAQVSVWQDAKPDRILALAKELESLYPDKIEFVRADHYFALYNEANGLPFDLSLSSKLSVSASSNEKDAVKVIDGTPKNESVWVAEEKGQQTLTFNLGGSYEISRFVIRHAGDGGFAKNLNTRDFRVETSTDGENWSLAYDYRDNARNVTDVDLASEITAGYLRIVITNPGTDGIARIADVEIYGAMK